MEKNIPMIAQRHFVVLDMSDRKDVTGKNFDPHVNLRVTFFTEHGDFPFEQVLWERRDWNLPMAKRVYPT